MTKRSSRPAPAAPGLFEHAEIEQRYAALGESLEQHITLLARRLEEVPTTWEQRDGQVSEANSAVETILRLYADILPDDLKWRVYRLTELRSRVICRGIQREG